MISRAYEPLTTDNTAVVLVDQQISLMTGVRDISTGELKHNVVALAKAAKALKLPIVLTTTARDSMWGGGVPRTRRSLARYRDHRSLVRRRTLDEASMKDRTAAAICIKVRSDCSLRGYSATKAAAAAKFKIRLHLQHLLTLRPRRARPREQLVY